MAIKVLIVLDGSYRFEPNNGGTAGFTFTALVAALTNAGMNVSRAHRLTGGDGDTGLNNFKFQTPQLFDYDVIWMFGHEGRNAISQSGTSPDALPQPEREAIARYMNAGGGVFATGDHDSIGAVMCGQLKRIRAMRSWYGPNDPAALANAFPVPFPANFPPTTSERADTTRRGDHTDYSATAADFVFFANQSDSTPQTITPLGSPAHMILRQGSTAITVFPDHMHEGKLIAPNVPPVDDDSPLDLNLYAESYSLDGDTLDEFPSVGGARELPEVIARSVTTGYKISNDSVNCDARDINTLCVYDGRKVGVGRIVTGATFHHYIDINLLGANNPPSEIDDADYNSAEDGGFAWQHADPAVFNKIKAVFVNITTWLARPRPAISLVLERSTFSQDEVGTGHTFPGAVLVTVDGLKPNQFPGGPIDTLSPSDAQLMQWAPQITPSGDAGFSIEPKGIASDDPSLPDRAQRFTFTYQVRFPNGNAFSVPEEVRNVQVNASLASPVTAAPLTDQAWFQLVKSANPFMLDLANGNDVSWLSSDVRSFPVVAGSTKFGVTLPENATRAQARQFIRDLVNSLDNNEFTSLDMSQPGSALSPSALSTSGKRVYNFAVARVRLNGQVANANNVRLFFRIFSSQTTAALTYELDGSGLPIAGYKRTSSAAPIALPGENPATGEWLSFPFFAEARSANPATQTDPNNVKNITPSAGNEVFTFFGALLDNNLANPGDEYLPALPGGTGPKQPLATLLAGEHQCLVAQIEYNGTPIPSGARPNTSDKLSQRNLAFSTVANPGLDGSRTAMHTFQIEATPRTISATLPPDELLLEWRGAVPANSLVRLVVPGWSAAQVIELADRYYPRHDLEADGADTVLLPADGTRYVPLPVSSQRRTGVLTIDFPLGIKKGQRFDVSVRQVTSRQRRIPVKSPAYEISLEEADKLLQAEGRPPQDDRPQDEQAQSNVKSGVYQLRDGRTLITDTTKFDAEAGQFAVIVEPPDPKDVLRAQRESGTWRETIGGFQLGVPVSDKAAMLPYHLQLLSIMRWRLEHLPRKSSWYPTMVRYLELLTRKVLALGGNPYSVPATPDGAVDLGNGQPDNGGPDSPIDNGDDSANELEPGDDAWLDDSNGLTPPDTAGARTTSGKISGLLFDHFGDFEGFTLESYAGKHLRFYSRENAILELARAAWTGRYVVTVITVGHTGRQVRRLLFRGHAS